MTRMAHLLERHWWRVAWWQIGFGLILALGMAWLVQGGNVRLAIAGALLALLGGLALVSPRAAILVTLAWLTLLGDFRRALIPLAGWPEQDVLLLVGPAVAVLLAALTVVGRPLLLDTALSRWILALMFLMLLQAGNPLQGSLSVGIAGTLFYVIPLLWFWIGRSYATPGFVRSLLYRVVVPLAVLASLLGIYQTFYDLLPYEQTWVELSGYEALNIDEYVRPISFFTSASEYGHYLGIALVVLWAGWLCKARSGLALVPLLVSALFLASMRGPMVMLLLTTTLLWAVRARSPVVWLPRLLLGLGLGVAALYLMLLQAQHLGLGGRAGALIDHQVSGLLNPLDAEESTATLHADMFIGGFAQSLGNPLGYGLGSTTIAANEFGGSGYFSTEVDFSNVFVSLGLPGGMVYLVVVGLVLVTAFRYWRRSRDRVALAIAGILIFELGGWLNGGHYAVTALIWFCIGALDRFNRSEKSP